MQLCQRTKGHKHSIRAKKLLWCTKHILRLYVGGGSCDPLKRESITFIQTTLKRGFCMFCSENLRIKKHDNAFKNINITSRRCTLADIKSCLETTKHWINQLLLMHNALKHNESTGWFITCYCSVKKR